MSSRTSGIYNASAPTLTTGQESDLQVDSSGNIKVNVVAGSGSGFSVTDESAWTAGTSGLVPTGGVFNDSAAALTSGQQGEVRVTTNRALHSNLRNAAGTEIGTSTTPLITQLGDGTNNSNIIASDTGQNGLITYTARKEVSFTTTTVQALATTDVSNYRYASIHITSQGGSSNVAWQASNDNTNWVASYGMSSANMDGFHNTSSAATSSGVIIVVPLVSRYFRLNVTGIASGTTAGVIEFFSSPFFSLAGNSQVNQGSSNWIVASNPTAATSGGYSTANFTAATTGTNVKASAGYIRGILIGNIGTVMTVQLFDSATSTPGSTKLTPNIAISTAQFYPLDVSAPTGICMVIGGTAGDVSVYYK